MPVVAEEKIKAITERPIKPVEGGPGPAEIREMVEISHFEQIDCPPPESIDTERSERDAEIIGLKALISSKNERIATLRTVLKANKHTAESGEFLNFKVQKYSININSTGQSQEEVRRGEETRPGDDVPVAFRIANAQGRRRRLLITQTGLRRPMR